MWLWDAAVLSTSRPTHAQSTDQIKAACERLTTCYLGSERSTPCEIGLLTCPTCVTFNNAACYANSGGGCPSWTNDCAPYWTGGGGGGGGGGGNSGSSGTSGGGGAQNATATPTPTPTPTLTPAATSNASSSSNSSDSAGTAGSAGVTNEEDSSDLSLVFAIIGAAMGVIAVGVIFLTLVRRSRAAREEDEEDATTPQTLAKEPGSSTAAVTYAQYGRDRNASSGATTAAGAPREETTTAASYYSQQPPNLPMASVVAGRAVPASATRPQPLPNNPPSATRTAPGFSNAAPLDTGAPTQQSSVTAQDYYPAPIAGGAAAGPRRVSSPRTRRDSFEF